MVIVPVVLVRACAPVGEPLLMSWARAHGVELSAANRSLVGDYLRRARVLRSFGAVGGLLLPTFVDLAVSGRFQVMGFASDRSAPLQGPMTIFVGYLVGALLAELRVPRRVAPAHRSASLIPRALTDYLPSRILNTQRALAAVGVVGVVAHGAVPYEDPGFQLSWPGVLAGVAIFALFAAALEALQRWLVRRPQPFTDPALVAADDAIRAQSVHALAGSGMALLWMGLTGVCIVLATSEVTVLRWTMWPLAVITFLLSIGACQDVAQRPWRVRRSLASSTGAAPT